MHASSSRVLSLTVLALSLHAATSAWAVGPDPGVNVTVTNPTSNPVPVSITGGATVSGTVAATQSGNWSVGVINSSTSPVPVNDVTKLQTFILRGTGANLLNQVPQGKIYIIEHWNVRCSVGATGSMTSANLRVAGFADSTLSVEDYAVPHFMAPNGQSNGVPVNLWGASGSPTIRVTAGLAFNIDIDASNSALITACVSSISGYIVNAI